jgi:quercetin dioxygenase-like cupin family protein
MTATNARHTPFAGGHPPTVADIEAELAAHGRPSSWSNAPGERYGGHSHGYRKHLVCVEGGITFHTPEGDVVLGPGDRLDLAPATRHSATVGPQGVTCAEVAIY